MKHKDLKGRPMQVWPRLALLVMGAAGLTCALAGDYPQLPEHFSGLLNDYTPASVNGVPIKGGPYEMHGSWKLDLDESRTLASFSAAVTMETAGMMVGAHTHHIAVSDGMVHDGPTDWTTMCPTFAPPVTGGFAITGTAYVTGNGGNVPFGNPTPVTICILGGTDPHVQGVPYVELSNFTLTFGSPASGHFGPQPIHGVVVQCGPPRWRSRPCSVNLGE